MAIHTETKTTFGLRDRRDGKFLHLDIESNDGNPDRDFCGSETVKFTTSPWQDGAPRYEVPDPLEVVRALKNDPHWYNSTRERPSWNGFSPEHLLPVRYELELDYDRPGGSPVARRERVLLQPMPLRFEGPVHGTRGVDQTPPRILENLFGETWKKLRATLDLDDPTWADIVVADTEHHALEPGMILRTSTDNTGQVDAIIDLPEGWPKRRHDGFDLSNPALRLALVRLNHMRAGPARDFVDEDFEAEPVTGPSP